MRSVSLGQTPKTAQSQVLTSSPSSFISLVNLVLLFSSFLPLFDPLLETGLINKKRTPTWRYCNDLRLHHVLLFSSFLPSFDPLLKTGLINKKRTPTWRNCDDLCLHHLRMWLWHDTNSGEQLEVWGMKSLWGSSEIIAICHLSLSMMLSAKCLSAW